MDVQRILLLLCPKCQKEPVQVMTLGKVMLCKKCTEEVFQDVRSVARFS